MLLLATYMYTRLGCISIHVTESFTDVPVTCILQATNILQHDAGKVRALRTARVATVCMEQLA